MGEGGYDGNGVQVIHAEADLGKGFNVPSVLEKKINIQKEIALIVGMNAKGETIIYPPAEMIFDPVYNLLDYQLSPAKLEEKQLWKAEAIARKIVNGLKSPGLFAIELFIDKQGDVWVNEAAPRVHNSGHHTIEANYSSQYDMLWRILLDYPLGNPNAILPSAIVNIIGAEGYTGEVFYQGLDEVLTMENVFVHLYGKKQTKPGRKMGHVTIISNDYQDLTHKANKIKHTLKAVTK
jgi:5-(carboxyamino)imidazole ribonucleotide synthase